MARVMVNGYTWKSLLLFCKGRQLVETGCASLVSETFPNDDDDLVFYVPFNIKTMVNTGPYDTELAVLTLLLNAS